MTLWETDFDGSSIHLAVDGSCGGTTLGLQIARQAISNGERVLWAAPELPDSTRFSQIFADISPTESSRFHAMNLVGNLDQALESLSKTANALPNVSLVVLDDYCPDSGQIPNNIISAVNKFITNTTWTTMLISKGGVSMDTAEPIIARSRNKIKTDKVWLLTRPDTGSKRVLVLSKSEVDLRLVDEGFIH